MKKKIKRKTNLPDMTANYHQYMLYRFCVIFITAVSFACVTMAAGCTGSLPFSNAITGWKEVANSTRSGAMGSKASYDAYDGAVEAMQAQGMRYFAQRIYRHATKKQYITVDIVQMNSVATAKTHFNKKLAGYKSARPLGSVSGVLEQARVGTMGSFSFGLCQRGKYVCEVTMTQAKTATDRNQLKLFLVYISKKFGS